jgi:hypothetical protein
MYLCHSVIFRGVKNHVSRISYRMNGYFEKSKTYVVVHVLLIGMLVMSVETEYASA